MKKKEFALSTFGLRLREHRQEKGRTIGDLADYVKMEPYEVSLFETGEKTAGLEYVRKVGQWLELSPLDVAELVHLARHKRSYRALQYYKCNKIVHSGAQKALQKLGNLGPAGIRCLKSVIQQSARLRSGNLG